MQIYDISWATTAKQMITYIKETTPSTLANWKLVINESKTEEYEIIRQGNERWKKCKLLGSLLDTEKNRTNILAIDAFKTLNKKFDGRKISNAIKIRTVNAYYVANTNFKVGNSTETVTPGWRFFFTC